MNKKLLALLLALAMLLALAACGGTKPEESPGTPENEETQEQAPVVDTPNAPENEPPAAPEAEIPQEPEAELPPEENDSTSAPPATQPEKNEKPAEKPVEKPAEKPEEPAAPANVDLAGFYEALAGNENWPAMSLMEGELLDAFYPGLSGIASRQSGVYMATISAVAGELALIQVENAADVEAVKGIFQSRIDYQVGDETNPGGAWYPETIEGWKNNSRIVSNGNYVMMVVMEGADDVVTAFHALFV